MIPKENLKVFIVKEKKNLTVHEKCGINSNITNENENIKDIKDLKNLNNTQDIKNINNTQDIKDINNKNTTQNTC